MERRAFGNSGLKVSVVGFGAGHIGGDNVDDKAVDELLNAVLDSGINLIDTARGYGRSEERIGRFLGHRRGDFVLSTKIGYGVEGMADWTPAIIEAGISQALARCRTEYFDIVHLHSCPLSTLQNSALLDALSAEVRRGRIRVAAYSGENEALDWAVRSGVFGSVQCSINVADQRSIERVLPETHGRKMGVIAKRPLANTAWRFSERPAGQYAEVYWERLRDMQIDPRGMDWLELALRFTISFPDVHSCIAGSGKKAHVDRLIEIADRGPLPAELIEALRGAFKAHDRDWFGQI